MKNKSRRKLLVSLTCDYYGDYIFNSILQNYNFFKLIKVFLFQKIQKLGFFIIALYYLQLGIYDIKLEPCRILILSKQMHLTHVHSIWCHQYIPTYINIYLNNLNNTLYLDSRLIKLNGVYLIYACNISDLHKNKSALFKFTSINLNTHQLNEKLYAFNWALQ